MGQQIDELARFAATTGWDDVPVPVRARARLVLLDTLACILAGASRPEVRALTQRLASTAGSGATVLAPRLVGGGSLPASDPRTASMLNAIAARSVELCEGLRGLQPGVHIVPAVIAGAEQHGRSGRAMMEALVLGYEVAGRLGAGFTPRAFAHPNGQVALLAAVAAGARLHGLDGPGIALAMRIATTMLMTPSYLNTAAGGTTLNLPAGMGAFAAGLAPEMAAAGYFARSDAIEEALGVMVGTGFDPAGVAEGLGATWQLEGSYFRWYACCNPIHPALDSLSDALAELQPAPHDIARIDVATFAFATVMNNAEPPNYFASKYSLPHAAATLIVRGGLGFEQLDDSAIADPLIAAIRPLVHIAEDPAMTARGPDFRPARVTIRLKDGRTATHECDNSRRDTDHPDPEPHVRAKFHQLAATMLTPAGTDAVEKAVDHAEDWPSMATFTDLLRQHQT